MKKRIFFGVLAAFLILVGICWGAELMNIRVAGEDGNMVFRDQSGNIIMTLDAANRKVTIPSGSNLTVSSGGTITGTGTATLTSPVLTTPSLTFGAAAKELLQIGETWTLAATEYICTLLTTTSGSSDATIIAPNTTGRLYVLRNASSAAVTIKKSGGTGVVVAAGKTAIVIHNGSDYVRVTDDATH